MIEQQTTTCEHEDPTTDEYRDGWYWCADCGARLGDEPRGAGRDYWGRPSASEAPEYWSE